MAYLIIGLFLIIAILSFLEDNLSRNFKLTAYIIFGVCLILMAGLREVGIDPDSENYQYTFLHYEDEGNLLEVEYSYLLVSQFVNFFTNDVHGLFLIYAFCGILLKLIAIREISMFYFLPLLVYLSYYFELHELTQIRTGILSGFLLLSIKPLAEGKKIQAIIFLLLGSLFHISGLMLFALLPLSNKKLSKKWKFILISIIPLSYLSFLTTDFVFSNTDIPYISNKLAMYQASEERGTSRVSINVFSPFHLSTIFIYYYLLYFSNTIQENNKYFPLMMKIFSIGIVCFTLFSFLPVLAERTSYLFRIISIILYTNIVYTIKPKWCSILILIIICIIYMNYGMRYIDFNLLWEV